ncbi:S41 family peptidase [Mangrovivirga sp. M17]|uniref:S41 family peptidase n=1 Tax=Mangrovivirga halotolerans TaxID=2993936 RepID=A0ABT3RUY8_9BACT|nr:S41 family peptidase [Mangrovivirga halotolerans]MCX2745443.1 S41 family peptidase [Mangrovivirga halotolerans]
MKIFNGIKALSSILILFAFLGCQEKKELPPKMTIANWEDDIEYLFNTLETKHINLYHSTPKNIVRQKVNSLIKELPNLSDDEIFIRLSKIIRSLDDSHTGIWAQSEFYDSYPLDFFVFSDNEIRVLKAPKQHPELLGAKLISIDNTPLYEITSEVLLVIQCADNWHSERERLARYLKYSRILKCLGIAKLKYKASFEFLLEDGTQKIVELDALPNTEYLSSLGKSIVLESPFQFENSLIGTSYLWYQPKEELKTAYIYFAGYPNSLKMKRFAVAISRDIIQRDIKNIIIDVRDNGGGDFYVGLELVKILSFIDQIDWQKGVYVITGRTTYSAGMSNTAHFKELLNAKIIGEPTGANPNDYQDAETFQLPNSKLQIQFSKRYYRFQDTVSNGIHPDVHIKPNWEKLKKGIDQNLQWILEDIKLNKEK